MKKIVSTIVIMLLTLSAHAQIVNVESLRKVNDTSKWSGNIGVDLNVIKNKNNILNIGNRTHLQYLNGKHLFLVVSYLNLQQVESEKFINTGTIHLRYNYSIKPVVAFEFFMQSQYDAVSNISLRQLTGLGPRFRLNKTEKFNFFLGTLIMHEYEKATAFSETTINRDLRASGYLSFGLYPNKQFSLVSTTYYQPQLNAISDYRISNDTSLAFEIFKGLGFKSSFNLLFDAFPPEGVPRMQYTWTNGIVYSFD